MSALSSMTGFGSARGTGDWGSWSVEIKSVNGRSLDVRVSLPGGFEALERHAKAVASKRLHRGNLQIAIRLDVTVADTPATINSSLLDQLIGQVQERSATSPTPVDVNTVATLMTVRGVVNSDGQQLHKLAEQSGVMEDLRTGVDQAVEQLSAMRAEEGQFLTSLLNEILKDMRRECQTAADIATEIPSILRERLVTQLAELGASDQTDPERLAAEVAFGVAKSDVREELDRLAAHLDQAESLLGTGSPCGRKLDFLSQEFGREINTLCSKSTSLPLTNAGLALKALNDQFKEQVANVE